ncbi:hypothetical protein QYF36_004420 [Acer negundo]|nr:hypothetical protein QYF36_004420 [Acer negundo]
MLKMSQKDDMVPMEAVPERKAVRQQSGETSRGNDVTQLISSSLEEKFKSLDKALTKLSLPDDEKDETILMRNRLGKKLKRFLGDKVFDWLTFKKKRVWHSSFRTIDELKAAGISPWGVIAFIAAILALALTIVQTVYTIEAYYNTDNHLAP